MCYLVKSVAESLVWLKLHDQVVFQEIESAGNYHWLVEKKSNSQAVRAYFANETKNTAKRIRTDLGTKGTTGCMACGVNYEDTID